jgi:putative sterol carrier protein
VRATRAPSGPEATKESNVAKYLFLSDEWMDEANKIRQANTASTTTPHRVRMNQIVTDVPFGEGTVNAHMDTSSGEVVLEMGHLEDPDLTVTLDYDTAKAIIVGNNPQAGMQAFMAGKIKVQGDMSKLVAMQSTPASPEALEVARQIQEITE